MHRRTVSGLDTERPLLVRGRRGDPVQLQITPTDEGFRLEGELDMATADDLSQLLRIAILECRPVVLDFSGVSFMDSSGLRALLEAAGQTERGGSLVVLNPSAQVRRVFDISIPAAPPGSRCVDEPRLVSLGVSRRLHDVIRRVMHRRHAPQTAGLIVLERGDELVAAVHHERSVPGDGLADGTTAEHQHLEGGRAGSCEAAASNGRRRPRRRPPTARRDRPAIVADRTGPRQHVRERVELGSPGRSSREPGDTVACTIVIGV